MRRQHAVGVDLHQRRKLIEPERRVLPGQHPQGEKDARGQQHESVGRRGPAAKRPGEEGKDQIELHLHRQRPQRAVQRRADVALGKEIVRERRVGQQIPDHRARGGVQPAGGGEGEHNQQAEPVAGQDARRALAIKPAHVRRLARGIGQIQQKAAEHQQQIHAQIARGHLIAQIDAQPEQRKRGIEPRLLPDVIGRHRQRAAHAQQIRRVGAQRVVFPG